MLKDGWEYPNGKMKLGPALGIFSDIWSEKFTDEEKLKAINRTMETDVYSNVPKNYLIEVAKWLAERLAEKMGEKNEQNQRT